MTALRESLDALGERIAEQAAHLDAATYRVLVDIHEFDEQGGWHLQGASSCAHWLAWRVGWDLVTARERVRVAAKLPAFPAIAGALRVGEVSYSKVRAMLRVASPDNERVLLEDARFMTGSQLEKACRMYARVQRGETSPRHDRARRHVRWRDQEDGMVRIEAVLHPEEAELVKAMLEDRAKRRAREAARRGHGPADSAESHQATNAPAAPSDDSCRADSAESPEAPPDAAVRDRGSAVPMESLQPTSGFDRADALVDIAQAYLRGERSERAPIDVVLAIPFATLRAGDDPLEAGWLGDTPVGRDTARRLCCDAGITAVIEDDHGKPLSVGRKQRTISGALKRALVRRDGGCTFPGCSNRVFLEAHHIEHWADGGETSLENAALTCSFHHRHLHEYGFSVALDDHGRPKYFDPRGRPITHAPEASKPPDLGWQKITAANADLEITAERIACRWDGHPVRYSNVIDDLVAADHLV